MQWAPDPTDLWAPDSEHARAWASDSNGHLTLIQAVDLFLAAKAGEGISPKTSSWYRMILARLAHAFEPSRPVDGLLAPEIRAWLLELRTTLAPVSVAGYVRTLKVFGNWLHAEELAEASAFHSLRKPRVPVKLIEPVPDDTLRRLLGLASVRDRAILLLLLDTGLRVSEAAGIRLGDLGPDGSVKVIKEVRGVGYPTYDNFDAIDIPYVDAIPSDHAGMMGVPITFLTKYNPDQFRIVGSLALVTNGPE